DLDRAALPAQDAAACHDEAGAGRAELFHRVTTSRFHHAILTSETPCLGNVNVTTTRPSFTSTRRGVSSCASCPAFSSCVYCAGVGDCGEPIDFQTLYELL